MVLSCLILFAMTHFAVLRQQKLYSVASLVCLCLLAGVEKLSSALNTISVERDWVVIMAEGDEERLRRLNSQMRRIDLFCKLVGPLAISFADAASTSAAIAVTAAITSVSVGFEYAMIARVYKAVPALRAPKARTHDEGSHITRTRKSMLTKMREACSSTAIYARHPAFLPSFALALLYLTVLSFAGQMITYLLALGLSSGLIGILRAVAAVFEMSATWLAPMIMERIGPVRAGMWFINWQIVCVGLACLFFWLDASPTLAAAGTVSAVIASRIGLWGFDLSAQIIVQEEVEADLRGTFSSQEFAFQNLFELLSFASTILFARPELFRYPATLSAGAVALAGVLYAAFVRMRRGHLVHLSKCLDGSHRSKHGWSRVAHEEDAGGYELVEGDRA